MDKSTISMAILKSKLLVYQRVCYFVSFDQDTKLRIKQCVARNLRGVCVPWIFFAVSWKIPMVGVFTIFRFPGFPRCQFRLRLQNATATDSWSEKSFVKGFLPLMFGSFWGWSQWYIVSDHIFSKREKRAQKDNWGSGIKWHGWSVFVYSLQLFFR